MCRQVYLACTYCGARRFFMWEECGGYWARYQLVVIDMDCFDERPRIPSGKERPEALACGRQQETRLSSFRLGRCPRLRTCASLQELWRTQLQKQQQGRQARPLGMGQWRYGDLAVEDGAERQRREFAERWFRKRPVPGQPRRIAKEDVGRLDGVVEEAIESSTDSDSETGSPAGDASCKGEPSCGDVGAKTSESLFGENLVVARPVKVPRRTQSMTSTLIESGSEVESGDWYDLYQSIRGLKVDSCRSL